MLRQISPRRDRQIFSATKDFGEFAASHERAMRGPEFGAAIAQAGEHFLAKSSATPL
jgi:hypothetical protein